MAAVLGVVPRAEIACLATIPHGFVRLRVNFLQARLRKHSHALKRHTALRPGSTTNRPLCMTLPLRFTNARKPTISATTPFTSRAQQHRDSARRDRLAAQTDREHADRDHARTEKAD
jgi:hypothetical protein